MLITKKLKTKIQKLIIILLLNKKLSIFFYILFNIYKIWKNLKKLKLIKLI